MEVRPKCVPWGTCAGLIDSTSGMAQALAGHGELWLILPWMEMGSSRASKMAYWMVLDCGGLHSKHWPGGWMRRRAHPHRGSRVAATCLPRRRRRQTNCSAVRSLWSCFGWTCWLRRVLDRHTLCCLCGILHRRAQLAERHKTGRETRTFTDWVSLITLAEHACQPSRTLKKKQSQRPTLTRLFLQV